MGDWQKIETAPRDGTPVMLKRLYKGRIVAEGPGVFGILHEAAPSRSAPGIDPLGRLTAADYAEEARDREEFVRSAKWLIPNRMYLFPTPTHWKPPPGSAMNPMSTFDPSKPAMVRDRLNDRFFEWKPETMEENYRQYAKE